MRTGSSLDWLIRGFGAALRGTAVERSATVDSDAALGAGTNGNAAAVRSRAPSRTDSWFSNGRPAAVAIGSHDGIIDGTKDRPRASAGRWAPPALRPTPAANSSASVATPPADSHGRDGNSVETAASDPVRGPAADAAAGASRRVVGTDGRTAPASDVTVDVVASSESDGPAPDAGGAASSDDRGTTLRD